MGARKIDLVGEPGVIAKVVELAKAHGHVVTEPMQTESVSDGLDGPFGAEELRYVCEVITVVMGAGTSVATFMTAVRKLLRESDAPAGRPPAVEVVDTNTQSRIGRVEAETDLAAFLF